MIPLHLKWEVCEPLGKTTRKASIWSLTFSFFLYKGKRHSYSRMLSFVESGDGYMDMGYTAFSLLPYMFEALFFLNEAILNIA